MKKLLLTIIIYFMMLSASYAYLDPGTGSVILQVILVALATCAEVFTNFWKKIHPGQICKCTNKTILNVLTVLLCIPDPDKQF